MFGADLVNQAENTVAMFNRVIPLKAQLGGMLESHFFSQLGAQEASGGVQYTDSPSLILLAADTADEDLSVFKVGSGLHRGNSDKLSESRVFQVVLDKLANFAANKGIDTFNTM